MLYIRHGIYIRYRWEEWEGWTSAICPLALFPSLNNIHCLCLIVTFLTFSASLPCFVLTPDKTFNLLSSLKNWEVISSPSLSPLELLSTGVKFQPWRTWAGQHHWSTGLKFSCLPVTLFLSESVLPWFAVAFFIWLRDRHGLVHSLPLPLSFPPRYYWSLGLKLCLTVSNQYSCPLEFLSVSVLLSLFVNCIASWYLRTALKLGSSHRNNI